MLKSTIIDKIKKYVRAANYLVVSQIYLQNNFLLKRELTFDDIKPRLLGHWGTCPGINFIYAHLNSLIKQHNLDMLFVLGPGHGFPALQANLFLEGTLQHYYPEATCDERGIEYLSKNFSWPYGFPSHSNPGAPGVILEGGELGYSLSAAYGAVLDNPELIVSCVIGDGEAETGALAASWHLNKFINPVADGAVLPILHLNGYKISGPTILGRMTFMELRSLFYGYGYEPLIVEEIPGEDIYQKMAEALENAYSLICSIQHKARIEKKVLAPRFPMIILKTPKGWTGIKELNGFKIEGNYTSHQVVASDAKTDQNQLESLQKWLKSYHFEELFDQHNGFDKDILDLVPDNRYRMGQNKHAYTKQTYALLNLPDIETFCEDATAPGTIGSSSMRRAGEYLNEVFKLNNSSKNFRLMSPDETYSNKLDKVFETVSRPFEWPLERWDKDLKPEGRVIEILSEHCLQGLLQGYILTGRHGVFASYEAFIQIVSSMVDQYSKFLKVAREIPWRGDIASINYILTSSGWRQDHNGFSHQNPGFMSGILEKQEDFIRVYLPADGNMTLAVLKRCLESKNGINIISAGKTLEPRWLTPQLAEAELEKGLAIWDFASQADPDLVFCGIGDYVTKEMLAAIDLLRSEVLDINIRFVNIVELTALRDLSCEAFNEYFTKDKNIIFNFHGYPDTLKKLLFSQKNTGRFSIHGYTENGSTTTPFDMHIRNRTSRYHLLIEALEMLVDQKKFLVDKASSIIKKYEQKIADHHDYITQYGVDPDEVENWKWGRES